MEGFLFLEGKNFERDSLKCFSKTSIAGFGIEMRASLGRDIRNRCVWLKLENLFAIFYFIADKIKGADLLTKITWMAHKFCPEEGVRFRVVGIGRFCSWSAVRIAPKPFFEVSKTVMIVVARKNIRISNVEMVFNQPFVGNRR